MFRRLPHLLFLLALTATACTSEGLPSSYSDQEQRTEKQFVAACEDSLEGEDESDPTSYCQCAFYTIAADLTFDEFNELDNRLREDPGFLSTEERALIDSVSLPCAFGPEDINTTVSQ